MIKSFLYNGCQRVIFNGQSSSWLSIRAGISEGQYWGQFFLVYINNLPEVLNSEVEPFADDTSLFSIVNCVNTSASTLNSDLLKIQDWAHQWKMSFNIGRTKQAQEIFSRKKNATTHHHSFLTILK